MKMIKLLILSVIMIHIKGERDYGHEAFSFRVKMLLNELERDFAMDATIETAKAKLKGVMFETLTEEKQCAALIINLYTSPDEITDAPGTTFYSSLNKELRKDSTGEIWQRCEALLNEALEIIGKETFGHLYRGERSWPASFPDVGDTYYVRSFWSTTLDPSVTKYFGGTTDFFYHIIGAKGVRIQNISVTDGEKEVLIQSARDYIIIRITRDQTEIHKEMELIRNISSGFDVTQFKPMTVITLMEKSLYLSVSTTTSGQHVPTESTENIIPPGNKNGCESHIKYSLEHLLAFMVMMILFSKISVEYIFLWFVLYVQSRSSLPFVFSSA